MMGCAEGIMSQEVDMLPCHGRSLPKSVQGALVSGGQVPLQQR